MRKLLPLAGVLVLAALPYRAFFGPAVPFGRDLPLYFLPLKAHLGEALRAGVVPWIDRYRWGGAPLLGAPGVAAFDPLNLLFVLLPLGAAVKTWILLRLGCGVAGFFVFARRRGLSPEGAALAGLVFGLSGAFVSFLVFLGASAALALLPWFAVACERALERPGARRLAVLAVVSALILVAGAPEFVLHAALVALALLPGRLRRDSAARQAGILAGAALLAAGLAAPALVSSVRATVRSTRGPGGGMTLALAGDGALPVARLPELALDGMLADWRVTAAVPEKGLSYPYLPSITPGRIGLLLAVLGLFAGRAALAPAALAVTGLLLALGPATFVWPALAGAVPLLRAIRYPEKHLALWGFGTVWLAALGIAVLERHLRPRARGWAAALLCVGVLIDREAMARGLMPVADGRVLTNRPPVLHGVPAADPPLRVLALETYRKPPRSTMLAVFDRFSLDTLWGEWGTLFGVATAFSLDYDLLLPREGFEWVRLLTRAVPTNSPVIIRLLRTTGVAAMVEWDRSAGRTRLLRIPGPLPPYRFVRRLVADPDGRRLVLRVLDEGFEPATAYLSAPPGPLPDALSRGDVLSVRDRPDALTIEVVVPGPAPGFLVVYRRLDAVEEATLDGAPVAVADVLFGFGGVTVPPGRHTVRLRPQTRSVRIGALMSLLSATVLGALALRRASAPGAECR